VANTRHQIKLHKTRKTAEGRQIDMSASMRRWLKPVRRHLFGALLLAALLAAGSCDGPTRPTTCMDACMAPANQCVVLTTGGVSGPPTCSTTYEQCKAKCQ
jgi:hypothetical protein